MLFSSILLLTHGYSELVIIPINVQMRSNIFDDLSCNTIIVIVRNGRLAHLRLEIFLFCLIFVMRIVSPIPEFLYAITMGFLEASRWGEKTVCIKFYSRMLPWSIFNFSFFSS